MRATPLVLLLCASLTACGAGGATTDREPGGTPRPYQRTESAVTVVPSTRGFTARRIVTVSNNDGAAASALVELVNPVGNVTVSPGTSGYQIQVTLQAEASTEQQARAALETLSVQHRDALGGSTLFLNNEVRFGPHPGGGANRSAIVAATLPPALDYGLRGRVGVGNLGSSGLSGSFADLDLGTGDASLSGTWDAAEVDTNVGNVGVSGDIARLQASAYTGNVQATLASVRDTDALLDVFTGNIEAKVSRTVDSGFDLFGEANTGSVTIAVAGTEAVGPQRSNRAHRRSPDFDSSDPQIRVAARTGVGNVLIHE